MKKIRVIVEEGFFGLRAWRSSIRYGLEAASMASSELWEEIDFSRASRFCLVLSTRAYFSLLSLMISEFCSSASFII
jgi:hypothetical protein